MIIHIIGTRPNFIKAMPVIDLLRGIIIHTGQHYDYQMSDVFFKELQMPIPKYHLSSTGTHAEQTGKAMMDIERILIKENPACVMVYGDVNSTLAGALAAKKLQIPVYHVESGCRSFDRTMPEEINRIAVDHISDILFCTEQGACDNLQSEGLRGYNVGNTSIDTLHRIRQLAKPIKPIDKDYYLCTLHRPFNVDDPTRLDEILTKLNALDHRVILPAHPRLNIAEYYNNIDIIIPLGYIDFISYLKYSKGMITDSGGVQCEACYLNIPTLTLRPTTEHTITLGRGNKLIDIGGIDKDNFAKGTEPIPSEWDGQAAQRIAEIL